jgi:ABC-type multidrug transport system ATPase subunit
MITLEVKNLKKSFGSNTVFSNISFLHKGKSLGIAGSNGSGKSTFLKCMALLLRPTQGNIQWKKNDTLLDREIFKKQLGYAAPYINLYNELSCRENLSFLAKVRHQQDDNGKIDKWIQKTGLEHVAHQPFGKLSTGQQQRLRLASALFHQPDILLLDEPGANLDQAGRSLITQIVHSFQSAEKLLIIASNTPAELDLCEEVFSIEQQQFT